MSGKIQTNDYLDALHDAAKTVTQEVESLRSCMRIYRSAIRTARDGLRAAAKSNRLTKAERKIVAESLKIAEAVADDWRP